MLCVVLYAVYVTCNVLKVCRYTYNTAAQQPASQPLVSQPHLEKFAVCIIKYKYTTVYLLCGMFSTFQTSFFSHLVLLCVGDFCYVCEMDIDLCVILYEISQQQHRVEASKYVHRMSADVVVYLYHTSSS